MAANAWSANDAYTPLHACGPQKRGMDHAAIVLRPLSPTGGMP